VLSMIDRLSSAHRDILPNIWIVVPDSRNCDESEGRLHASASVNFRLDISYSRTFR
jgi:hypothetical protein